MRNAWCRRAGAILLMILVAGCAAERLHHQGLNAMDRGEYENGLNLLKEAAQADPHNMSYHFDYATRREAAVLAISVPVWVALLAWPILGERLSPLRAIALLVALGGIFILIGGNSIDGLLRLNLHLGG